MHLCVHNLAVLISRSEQTYLLIYTWKSTYTELNIIAERFAFIIFTSNNIPRNEISRIIPNNRKGLYNVYAEEHYGISVR